MAFGINPDNFPDIDSKGGVTKDTIFGSPRRAIDEILTNTKLTVHQLYLFMQEEYGLSDKTYIHEQGMPSTIWTINHPLEKYVSVTVVDSGNNIVEGAITYIDDNNLTISFNSSFSGAAYLN